MLMDFIKTASASKATHEMQASNAPSPLLKLPGEIRNNIYTFVAHGTIQDHVTMCAPPALLFINRQLRAEFSDIYYSSTFMDVRMLDKTANKVVVVEEQWILRAILSDAHVRRWELPSSSGNEKAMTEIALRYGDGVLTLPPDQDYTQLCSIPKSGQITGGDMDC